MRLIVLTNFCMLLLLSATVASAKIVFGLRHDGFRSISVVDDDGGNEVLLTNTLVPTTPRWSPDGKQIVFVRTTPPGVDFQKRHIFVMNADGTHIRQLTPPIFSGRDNHPSFSSDGETIVFRRFEQINDKNRSSVCVMNLKTGLVKTISDTSVNRPDWSPDGKHIVYAGVSKAGVSGANIWIMEADGDDVRELLPQPVENEFVITRTQPRWSPDGKQILYVEDRDIITRVNNIISYIPQGYYYYIYDLRTKQSQELKIPKDLRPAGRDWMGNGKYIVFSAAKRKLKTHIIEDTAYNIYKYNIRSEEVTQLTHYTLPADPEPFTSYGAASLDWISDHAHAVSPTGKKTVQWGQLKAFLNSRYKALKTFSSGLSDFFLQHLR